MKNMPIKNGSKYALSASTGTTVSHISDIVGLSGLVFAVEPATRVARELIENVASKRKNVLPILEDAKNLTHILQYSAKWMSSTATLRSLTKRHCDSKLLDVFEDRRYNAVGSQDKEHRCDNGSTSGSGTGGN